MTVFRVNKTSDYTVMSNYHLKNKKMSNKAKGLLTVMLSLPDNWDYSIKGLTELSNDSENGIRTQLKELEDFNHLKRTAIRNEKGQILDWQYDIYEEPGIKNELLEKPDVQKPQLEKQQLEKSTQLNTNILNTKEIKETIKEKFDEWMEYKKQRKEKYTEIGLNRLISQINSNVDVYGVENVKNLIDVCMANNYKGIIFDKLSKMPIANAKVIEINKTAEGEKDEHEYEFE